MKKNSKKAGFKKYSKREAKHDKKVSELQQAKHYDDVTMDVVKLSQELRQLQLATKSYDEELLMKRYQLKQENKIEELYNGMIKSVGMIESESRMLIHMIKDNVYKINKHKQYLLTLTTKKGKPLMTEDVISTMLLGEFDCDQWLKSRSNIDKNETKPETKVTKPKE